jgi:DNA-binding response OmpR family regulator
MYKLMALVVMVINVTSVIVIDDEPELANLFNAFLIKEGYNVITFIDPVLAFEYFKKTSDKHSLIITDMRMPGLSGIDLAKRIREINSKIVIFLMTAFDLWLERSTRFQISKNWYVDTKTGPFFFFKGNAT